MEIVYLIMGATAGVFLGFTAGGYMLLKELAKKDMEIANKKAMIKNRNITLDKVIAERNELREYKQDVEKVINSKGTIVDKFDKIIEVTTAGN